MQQPKKDPPIPSGGFPYDVDAALATSMKHGTMHEWVLCELRAVCRGYGLSVRGNKADVGVCCNPCNFFFAVNGCNKKIV